jgi:hypothetical protein
MIIQTKTAILIKTIPASEFQIPNPMRIKIKIYIFLYFYFYRNPNKNVRFMRMFSKPSRKRDFPLS